MTASLSLGERQIGLFLSVAVTLVGLVMAVSAGYGAMAVHGSMAMVLGIALIFILGGSMSDPEPPADRIYHYHDAPIRFGIVMTLIWAVIAMGVGVWVAALLYWPEATPALPWTSFGRLRPVHTTGIIFGFGGNALIATSFYVVQRTSRARLADA
ncbi:MAG TPA: cbb3-type cytochrome c oxidase subunit I, partial [Hyphomicrobiaceae bacterium]|nr:cbb3-type cytochrome c oxidase subunit I [Hyphomicrobiaceae bacterium]